MSSPEISVVVPVYRCAPCLEELHRRLTQSLSAMKKDYELVLVEDGGDDDSWRILESLAKKDSRVRALKLTRNFGQHAAITAGLAESSGARVVVMDCDLQDPPEEIAKLCAKADEGFDVVYARRNGARHSLFRRASSRVYFFLLKKLNKHAESGDFGAFSLISRRVVESYLTFKDQDRHYSMILRWLGFPSAVVDYEQRERPTGESSYTLPALIRHAFDGLCFQTTVLLRWIVYFGFLVSFLGGLLAARNVWNYVFYSPPSGWTSLACLILVMGGVSIFSIGVSGLYIGKIFDQVRGRPLYVIEKRM